MCFLFFRVIIRQSKSEKFREVKQMEFKDKVKAVRGELLLTQEQFAKELGCTATTVNRWENGKKPPSFILEQAFKKFCKEKGINLDELRSL